MSETKEETKVKAKSDLLDELLNPVGAFMQGRSGTYRFSCEKDAINAADISQWMMMRHGIQARFWQWLDTEVVCCAVPALAAAPPAIRGDRFCTCGQGPCISRARWDALTEEQRQAMGTPILMATMRSPGPTIEEQVRWMTENWGPDAPPPPAH